MPKQRMAGFQKPVSPTQRVNTGRLPIIRYTDDGVGATCSCMWVGTHSRSKVLEDKIDKHLIEKHAGRGIRL